MPGNPRRAAAAGTGAGFAGQLDRDGRRQIWTSSRHGAVEPARSRAGPSWSSDAATPQRGAPGSGSHGAPAHDPARCAGRGTRRRRRPRRRAARAPRRAGRRSSSCRCAGAPTRGGRARDARAMSGEDLANRLHGGPRRAWTGGVSAPRRRRRGLRPERAGSYGRRGGSPGAPRERPAVRPTRPGSAAWLVHGQPETGCEPWAGSRRSHASAMGSGLRRMATMPVAGIPPADARSCRAPGSASRPARSASAQGARPRPRSRLQRP